MLFPTRGMRPLVIGAALIALLSPAVPAAADPKNPTAAELRAARERVSQAQSRVSSLSQRASSAAEAYNGAMVVARRAAGRSDRAAQLSATAQRNYALAQLEIEHARVAEQAARQWADLASEAAAQARAKADEQQLALDRIAVGAFQTDGKLGMVSQLLVSPDPVALAQARTVLNRVSRHQETVIAAAHRLRAAADAAAHTADIAESQASAAADRAVAALPLAIAAKAAAESSAADARAAEAEAAAAAQEARIARGQAMSLVAQAERSLGSAKLTAAQLNKAAREARAAAKGTWSGSAPSQGAKTAIAWAYDQIGVPYSWGGGDENGPTRGFAQGANTVGFDCSGLTLFVYAKAGVRLDHYSQSQWGVGKRIHRLADVQPGDLLFYAYNTSDPSTIHHVAISVGNGKIIEAPYTGQVVRVASANRPDFIGATRPLA